MQNVESNPLSNVYDFAFDIEDDVDTTRIQKWTSAEARQVPFTPSHSCRLNCTTLLQDSIGLESEPCDSNARF
jgi:hypothetical protein